MKGGSRKPQLGAKLEAKHAPEGELSGVGDIATSET